MLDAREDLDGNIDSSDLEDSGVTWATGFGDSVVKNLTPVSVLMVDGWDFGVINTRYMIFGGENGETGSQLTGEDGDDRIYGGGGDDRLEGRKGANYLEGGKGNDAYYIASDGKTDTIRDIDRNAVIYLDGEQLPEGKVQIYGIDDKTGKELKAASWTGANGISYYMDGTALEVIKNDQIEIRIEDYFLSNGSGDDFGVTLGVLDISDTYTPMIELSSASYDQVLLAEQVRSVSTGLYADSVTGTIFNDYVRLGSGDDNAQTSLGKDIVFGEEGNDYIVAGLQTSTAENALLDEDFVVGGAGRDILLGGVGNDTLHAGEIDDHLLLATSESDNSGDWADGGSGMDTVYGSLASDFLEGGAFRHAGKQRRGQPESQGDGHRPRKLVRQPDLCAHSTKCKRRAGSGGQCPGANGEGRRSLYLDTAGNPVYRPGR